MSPRLILSASLAPLLDWTVETAAKGTQPPTISTAGGWGTTSRLTSHPQSFNTEQGHSASDITWPDFYWYWTLQRARVRVKMGPELKSKHFRKWIPDILQELRDTGGIENEWALDSGYNKMWKILQEMGVSDHLTRLLRNLYAGQEAKVSTRHGTTEWFQIGKGVLQGCILSPCLFNLYAEYIMWNARLDEAQAGIKIAGRNTNNLRYAGDTTLMAKEKN